MPLLTVFTPTYNRAYCLSSAYEALKRQTCKDFSWLIIDDGSTDNTRELVADWQARKNDFEIRYVYKENGGLYSGYTTAFKYIDSELCVCVDSDDYLTENAVELIHRCWEEFGSKAFAGIVGLDCLKDGSIIGETFPPNIKTINLIDTMIGRGPVKDADWKNVVRTELYKAALPSKEITELFSDEKDFNPHYLHIKICESHDFLALNKALCVVNYQPDGMTATVLKQYIRSPNSFRVMRLQALSYSQAPFRFKARNAVHYISSCILSRKPCLPDSPQKALTLFAYPLGLLWTFCLLVYGALTKRGKQ